MQLEHPVNKINLKMRNSIQNLPVDCYVLRVGDESCVPGRAGATYEEQ